VEPRPLEGWVLIAEDDAALRFLLASVLRKDGHRVLEAPDGQALVLAHAALPPGRPGRTIVLSDLSMPVRSGLSAVEELQGREPSLGIILMGAFLEPEDAVRARALGAAFLTKPFELATMRSLVRRLMDSPGSRSIDLLQQTG
jgi:DNA-binding response OmpR family regulator